MKTKYMNLAIFPFCFVGSLLVMEKPPKSLLFLNFFNLALK